MVVIAEQGDLARARIVAGAEAPGLVAPAVDGLLIQFIVIADLLDFDVQARDLEVHISPVVDFTIDCHAAYPPFRLIADIGAPDLDLDLPDVSPGQIEDTDAEEPGLQERLRLPLGDRDLRPADLLHGHHSVQRRRQEFRPGLCLAVKVGHVDIVIEQEQSLLPDFPDDFVLHADILRILEVALLRAEDLGMVDEEVLQTRIAPEGKEARLVQHLDDGVVQAGGEQLLQCIRRDAEASLGPGLADALRHARLGVQAGNDAREVDDLNAAVQPYQTAPCGADLDVGILNLAAGILQAQRPVGEISGGARRPP
mgnify:CR=1 FL=1